MTFAFFLFFSSSFVIDVLVMSSHDDLSTLREWSGALLFFLILDILLLTKYIKEMTIDRRFINAIQSFLPVQIFLCYCFCVSGLLINVIQLITWILIWPFNKKLYRQINYHLGTLLWSRKWRRTKETFDFDLFFRIDVFIFVVGQFWNHRLCRSKRSSIA